MTLTAGLNVARSGLAVTADLTALVSRNVARASDPGATKKTGSVVTGPGGGVQLASVNRAFNASLFEKVTRATSVSAAQQAIVDALNMLDETINDPELEASPAALVGKLADALQQYSGAPHDPIRGQAVLAAAGDVVVSLNSATQLVQQVRSQADADIGDAVGRLNTLLSQFETVNRLVVEGTHRGSDVTDLLDQRDQMLTEISEYVGIRTVTRADNSMMIYTDSGVTLFETKARTVSFERTLFFSATTTGNPILVDGVPITGPTSTMTASSGRLVGLTAVRDDLAVTYQNQLDEIARGLIEIFGESDQSDPPTLPDVPGLFTYAGAPDMPPSGTVLAGLAGAISLNATVDPAQGGNLNLLRDGGIGDPGNSAYLYNTSGAAGFSGRLEQLLGGLTQERAFDPEAKAIPSGTLTRFASSSVAWLQEARKSAGEEAEYRSTLLERSKEALSKETGVNLDEEMILLLDLERTYQASTKLISTIDDMMAALIAVAG